METKELDELDFEGRQKSKFSQLTEKLELTDNLNAHMQIFRIKVNKLMDIGRLVDEARQQAAHEANRLHSLTENERKLMSDTILEQVMQKYHCTTTEELEEKRQELKYRVKQWTDMVDSAIKNDDLLYANSCGMHMDAFAAQVREIEDAVRSL